MATHRTPTSSSGRSQGDRGRASSGAVAARPSPRSRGPSRELHLRGSRTPPDRKQRRRGVVAIEPVSDGEPLAQVFKTIVDPFVGPYHARSDRLWHAASDHRAVEHESRRDERLPRAPANTGQETSPISEAIAGDVIAIPKLADARIGDTLARAARRSVIAAARRARGALDRGATKDDRRRRPPDDLTPSPPRRDPALVVEPATTRHIRRCSPASARPTFRSLSNVSRASSVSAIEREELKDRLPREISRALGGRGALQEADRRPRPVRCCTPTDRAPRIAAVLRLRRPDRRWSDPPPVHSPPSKRASSARCATGAHSAFPSSTCR